MKIGFRKRIYPLRQFCLKENGQLTVIYRQFQQEADVETVFFIFELLGVCKKTNINKVKFTINT